MDGILLIDKPKGWTSFDVVAKVRAVLRSVTAKKVKVGHTGTLDPLATGLLVILIGNYTKRALEYSKLDKTYAATMRLGQTSTTGDEEGEKQTVSARRPVKTELEGALKQFLGQIEQVPPAYSAIKIGGQRAYKLARLGKTPKLGPRPITIRSLRLDDYDYPLVKLTAEVSSGTYIRTLVEDIGRALGTGAYTSELRRTKVAQFHVEEAIKLNDPRADFIESNLRR